MSRLATTTGWELAAYPIDRARPMSDSPGVPLAVVVEVAAPTLGHAVGQVGEPALLPRCDVVDVAALGFGAAARATAPQGEQGSALGGGERP